jgi:phenylacetate-CoA ligase
VATAAQGGPVWAVEPIKRQLIFSSDHLERRFMPQYAEALERYRPQWIEAFPSALYPLARWLRDHPMPEVTDRIRGVMLFSENVYGFQDRLFREVFGCPIVSHYGHSERVLMAATLPGDDRYHFWPQYGWFELLDDDGNPITRPGEVGHVVGTGYDNRVMPFVRYRTVDLAVLSEAPASLAGFPVCDRIEGRVQEFVVCRDERLISLTTLGVAHFPELASVEAIQYEQSRPGHLVLRVVCGTALAPEARASIAHAVERKTQGGCAVEVEQVARIERTPRGKARLLLQHLDIGDYFGAAVDA